jgi:hypothetical protein
MLAHGFPLDLLADPIRAGLAVRLVFRNRAAS